MFMTNYELVYGKRKFSPDASNTSIPMEYHSNPVMQSEESDTIESSKTGFMQSAVGFMKSDDTKQKLGSLAGKLKNAAGVAAGAASGFAKNAVDTAKSEETAAKIASIKEKAQSVAGGIGASVSGLSSKASEAISSRKHFVSNEIDFSETDITHTEEYSENTIQEETVYADDDSETSSQEYYASDEEIEADEYTEEYEGASDETEEEIHVYNEAPKVVYHSQTVYTRTHGNYSNMYEQADYTNSQEKSNKKPVIIGIAAGLGICAVFAGGLFGGMYLMKNKNDTPDNDKVIAENTTVISNIETPAEKNTEEEKTEVPTEEKTEPQTTVTIQPYEQYEEAAMKALANFMDSYFGDIVSYGLVDVSGEGVPELIINYATEGASASSVFVFNGSDYDEPICLGEGVKVCFSEHLIEAYGYGGAKVRFVYEIDNHGEFILKDEIREEYTGYNWVYTLNGRNITNTEYDEINRVYDSMEWESVCVNEYKRENMQPQNSQLSFSTDINDYPLYLEVLCLIAQNTGNDNYDYESGLSIAYSYSDTEFGYSLQDLNNDGIPELIITGEMSDGGSIVTEIYTISNNQFVTLCQTWGLLWYYMCDNNVIVSNRTGDCSAEVAYYNYTGGIELKTIDSYSWEYVNGTDNYYINGTRVSDYEIQQLKNKYKSTTIDTIPLSSISFQ